MKFIKKNIGVLFVLLFAILASLPLFQNGFFPMHDDEQIARLFDLNQALALGQFPPRLAPNLGFGYGYPFFNFYPSFAYYVGEMFHVLGFGYLLSTKLMLFTGFLLAGYFIYLLVKEFFGEEGGIISAAAYTFAPYHAVDIYVRGAFAEFFAFVFLPLIFWASYKLFKTKKTIFIVPLSLSVCFLILSHDLIAMMSAPFIGLWLLYLLFSSKKRKDFFVWSSIGFILGFGLSAFFFLPSYVEMGYTLVRILTSELANYNLHFVCIHQLFSSPWGYGGSIPDCNDGLSFEVGKIHLLASFIAILGFLYYKFKKKLDEKYQIIPVFFVLLGFGMFMTTRESKIIWDAIPQLWFIQFPWRFLELTALCASVLAGSVVIFSKDKKIKMVTALVVVILLIYFNISDFNPSKLINVSDASYTSLEKLRWETSSLAYEYVPSKISTKKSKDNTTQVNITKDQVKTSAYSVIKGDLMVNIEKDLPQEKIFSVTSTEGGILRINTYSFPGWNTFIDGHKVSYNDLNKLVLIDVSVPSGAHTVRAVFSNTPIRTLSNMISILSLIGILAVGVVYPRKSGKSEK